MAPTITPQDEPPVYCYANWDDATRRLVGDDAFPPADYCNVACAYHMGDPVGTYRRIKAAIQEGKAICAHPGLDIAKNGRLISAEEVYTFTICQLGALKALVEAEGGRIDHVKPHGILSVLLRDQDELMRSFLKAQTALLGMDVPFHGLSQTNHEAVSVEMGVPFVGEILKDKVDLRRSRSPATSAPDASERPPRPRLNIRQAVRPTAHTPTHTPSATMPHSNVSSVLSSPSSSAPSSSPSSTRTSSDEDMFPRTIAYTLQSSTLPTRSREASSSRASPDSAGVRRPALPTVPPTAKVENSAQRLIRSLQYWSMTPIPTMIDDHRSSSNSTPRSTRVRSTHEAYPNHCETQ